MKHTELLKKLRDGHYEINDEAADAIESLQAEVERLTSDRNLEKKLRKDSEERAYNAESERDALKLDAARYLSLLEGIVDIYCDGTDNPDEARAYADDAFPKIMNDAIAAMKGAA